MVIKMQNNHELSKAEWENIGNRIKIRRHELKLKQGELAEKLDISTTHISAIERGVQHPSLGTLLRLSEALNTTPDYFLLGNIHSKNVPQNIIDILYICDDEQLGLVQAVIETMVLYKK